MRIDLLDLTSDADCLAAYEAVVASSAFGRPWFDPPSARAVLAQIRAHHDGERNEQWVVRAPEVVAVAMLWLTDDDNTDKAWLELDVQPDARRHGYGRALAEHMMQRARLDGRSIVVVDVIEPAGSAAQERPNARFAESLGFELANTEAHRVLDLPVAEDLLERLDASVRPKWSGTYRVETYVDDLPQDLIASYCECTNRLATDAPTGDLDFEAESLTPEKFAQNLAIAAAAGARTVRTVAVHPDAGVVAYSDISLADGTRTAWQEGTLVRSDHRGHGLGMAVKVANLRALQADHPDRIRVVTGNADDNVWMLAINERLGFRMLEASLTYQRRL